LPDYLARSEQFDLSLVGSLVSSRHPRKCFTEFLAQQGRPPRKVRLWIGPEGDFTEEELAQIEATGAYPVSFGSQTLRSETAALYCLAIAHYEMQEQWPTL
jgi:16S rRNA (uracil1498-N3)-methyltransferase